jgi:hypothetical protein
MKLYKKDFEAFARIISNARRQNTPEQALDHVASDLADLFRSTNDNFNRNRFIEACEPKQEPNWKLP